MNEKDYLQFKVLISIIVVLFIAAAIATIVCIALPPSGQSLPKNPDPTGTDVPTVPESKTVLGQTADAGNAYQDQLMFFGESTTFHMISYLKDKHDVTVVTNGIHTAMELQRNNNFKSIVLIGGMLRPHSGAVEGLMSREMVNRLSAEYYFVSGNGFSVEAGLSGNNFYELELKKLCAERSKNIVALVDSTKMGIDSASGFLPAAC